MLDTGRRKRVVAEKASAQRIRPDHYAAVTPEGSAVRRLRRARPPATTVHGELGSPRGRFVDAATSRSPALSHWRPGTHRAILEPTVRLAGPHVGDPPERRLVRGR